MAKIFISHSSENKNLVELLVDFLQRGMGVNREDIFCTSYPKSLPTGKEFISCIKDQIQDCEAIIFLITEEYLRSPFCLAEMGAAWALGKEIYPLLTVDISRLNHTPLSGIQMRKLNDRDDISAIYDEFCENNINRFRNTGEFTKHLDSFIENVNIIIKGEHLLKPDSEGNYCVEICEVRKKVPERYRCYKIKGHIFPWKSGEGPESDWLFYYHGVYPDLQVGDRVCIKVSDMEERTFGDIGWVRNIYPSYLKKI